MGIERTTESQGCASVIEFPLGEARAAELAGVLGAIADPVRLRLLALLAAEGEVCSCDLESPLGRSQPTISHHTRVLANAGLVVGEKRGRWTWWRTEPTGRAALRLALQIGSLGDRPDALRGEP